MKAETRIAATEVDSIPLPAGRLSRLLFQGDGIELRHYAPKGTDPQTPHDRDEFYFVISGTGTYERAGEKVPFGPGDMLFAAAGEDHRFSNFSDDFATWVLFYGDKKA